MKSKNDSNKYSPYWILYPLTNETTIKSYKNWELFTSEEVRQGKSPLTDLGELFYQSAHNHASLYDRCLWIFNNSKFDGEIYPHLTQVLKNVSGSFCNSLLSNHGVIVTKNGKLITKQPATPEPWNNVGGDKLSDNKLNKILNITELIFQNKLNEYFDYFKYLREIRQSNKYIRELALWSFVEQHWNRNAGDSELYKSLENLMDVVYNKTPAKKIEFKDKLNLLGQHITKKPRKYYLTHIRNSLAHGWFFKQKETWDQDNLQLYYRIHKELLEMVLRGLEIEINEISD